jgi:hypothetical protein
MHSSSATDIVIITKQKVQLSAAQAIQPAIPVTSHSMIAAAHQKLIDLEKITGSTTWKEWMAKTTIALQQETQVNPMSQEDMYAWWWLRATAEINWRKQTQDK